MVQLIETGEVARRLGVSAEYVRQLARRGLLRVQATTSRGVRLFEPEVVQEYEQRRERPAPTDAA